MTLKYWTARRAGGRITVTGKAEDGSTQKIVGVDYIEPPHAPGARYVVAVDKDGNSHELTLL